MSDTVIQVDSLGKKFRRGVRPSYARFSELLVGTAHAGARWIRDRAGGMLSPGNGHRPELGDHEFWALKDVSFEVKRGEVLGIIGRNGAGKSTLLKLLSRISRPTTGEVRLRGRVGSLLEVGTGFHPELTGRENIYLNGTVLGMRKSEIDRKFDEIVDFAEIQQSLDTPVKHYSSGMYMRLAFAVAAHLEPEVLLIDEVLAVGDADFQRKCLGKMGEVARGGRTVLFVSHNMTAVESLCGTTIWLDQGSVAESGPSRQVVPHFLRTTCSSLRRQVWNDLASAPGNDTVRLHKASVRPVHGGESDPLDVHTPVLLEFQFWNRVPGICLNLSIVVCNESGVPVFNTVPIHEREWHDRPFPRGLFRSRCVIPGDLLNDSRYRVQFYVVKDQSSVIYSYGDILVFDVLDDPSVRRFWFGKWAGVVRPALEWSTEFLGTSPIGDRS